MTRPGVIFDLVAAQSPSYRGRGIARYSTDFVRAMARYHPDLVAGIAVHPELEPPDDVEGLSDWLTTQPDWAAAGALHMSSVFEPEVPVQVYWPRQASAHRLLTAVTVYDLIPDIFPELYLQDPGLRRRWRCCREVVRTADAVLTLSASAQSDTINMLGVPAQRVHVVGSGCSEVFQRPESRRAAWHKAHRAVKGLKEGFIIYNGAFNPRKNVDGLVQAYAALPQHLIDKHQLVIVCHARPLERNHYMVMARELGLRGRILLPGFLPEDILVSLYQCTELSVFPSLYEGYGLPVVEGMACGAPTIAGDNSSLVEILPAFARFDARDPAAMSESIVRALTDEAFRLRLAALTTHERPSWQSVADRAAEIFDQMSNTSRTFRPGWRARPHLALVGAPLELVRAVGRVATHDVFERPDHVFERPDHDEAGTGPETGVPGSGGPLPFAALAKLDPWVGGYDAVVAWHEGAATLGALEELAAIWPGRAFAVVRPGAVGTPGSPPADLDGRGVSVVTVGDGPGWDETAVHLVGLALSRAG